MKFFLTVSLLIIQIAIFGQITVVNEFNIPINNAELFSKSNTLIAKSNINGNIIWNSSKNVNENDTICIKHPEYENYFVVFHIIQSIDSIVLIHKTNVFPEVHVNSNKITKSFQIMNACFRSYQLNNDSLIYYIDGKVDYLTKTDKIEYKKMLKEHRIFKDTNYLNNQIKRNYEIAFSLARVSQPLTNYLPKKYFKQHHLKLIHQPDGSIHIETKKKVKIGSVELDSNLVRYTINDIYSCKKRKTLKYEANQINSDITLVFTTIEEKKNDLEVNFDKLVYSRIYRKYDFKHASDSQFTSIENVEEIFVEDIHFSNEVDQIKFNDRFGFPKQSKFSTSFWEKCNCKLYALPPFNTLLKTSYSNLPKI